ncbi:uncharacterized protein UTRI_02387 [Ustilago trichophora]|uniref:Protein kinase domain-containing protein n=1 Tax=Ustilago trichophora TaxID=86804 RepID=A0A5C3E6G5_9BASI|nr:uncharacterized protein UTRI_02387 [Ustilago trichophora]
MFPGSQPGPSSSPMVAIKSPKPSSSKTRTPWPLDTFWSSSTNRASSTDSQASPVSPVLGHSYDSSTGLDSNHNLDFNHLPLTPPDSGASAFELHPAIKGAPSPRPRDQSMLVSTPAPPPVLLHGVQTLPIPDAQLSPPPPSRNSLFFSSFGSNSPTPPSPPPPRSSSTQFKPNQFPKSLCPQTATAAQCASPQTSTAAAAAASRTINITASDRPKQGPFAQFLLGPRQLRGMLAGGGKNPCNTACGESDQPADVVSSSSSDHGGFAPSNGSMLIAKVSCSVGGSLCPSSPGVHPNIIRLIDIRDEVEFAASPQPTPSPPPPQSRDQQVNPIVRARAWMGTTDIRLDESGWPHQPARLLILLELLPNNLALFARKHSERVDLQQWFDWALQMSDALVFLHEKGCVHADIKKENMLLTEDLEIKLCDFNSAVFPNPNDPPRDGLGLGTPAYCAPELSRATGGPGATTFSYPIDIFSLGAVLYSLATGTVPAIHHHNRRDASNDSLESVASSITTISGRNPPLGRFPPFGTDGRTKGYLSIRPPPQSFAVKLATEGSEQSGGLSKLTNLELASSRPDWLRRRSSYGDELNHHHHTTVFGYTPVSLPSPSIAEHSSTTQKKKPTLFHRQTIIQT